jgi:hypothetical protein
VVYAAPVEYVDTPDDRPPAGSPTVRYPPREQTWEPAADGDPAAAEAIEEHIARHFGPIDSVLHEVASDLVHLDVHVVVPSSQRPYFTLVTSGMSDRPMTVPAGTTSSRYAELMLCLPPDWPLSTEAYQVVTGQWPVWLLKMVGRLPHMYGTWIDSGHSVPNGDPAQPFTPEVAFVGAVVTPMLRCEPAARTITVRPDKQISLLALIPVHAAELDLKLAGGAGALFDAFDRAGVSELVNPARPSSV